MRQLGQVYSRIAAAVFALSWSSACGPQELEQFGSDQLGSDSTELRYTAEQMQTTPPYRPTYQDVSIKKGMSYIYQWARDQSRTDGALRTATQVQRDAMEETLVGIVMPEALRYARTMPSCQDQMSYAFSNYNKITSKLGNEYEQKAIMPSAGTWLVTIYGRHYQFEQLILTRLAACSTENATAAAACAANPRMNANLLDAMDLRIEGKTDTSPGKCVRGALFSLGTPVEEYDSYRAEYGAVTTKHPVEPPNHELVHQTHEAHAEVTQWRCGELAAEPTKGKVQNAHKLLESTAVNEEQHHFIRMKDFNGFEDTPETGNPNGWTREEICTWARLQDIFHARWMHAVAHEAHWGHARRADDDHQLAHICMNLNDTRLLVKFSCAPEDIRDCPVRTCQQVLADYKANPFYQ